MKDSDWFALWELTLRDFRIRYRNMSLGLSWSVLNPLVMVAVFSCVFLYVFPNPAVKSLPVFILCGLIPYNFFQLAWISGTLSLSQNAALVKRVSLPREVIPLATVASLLLHFGIQIMLLAVCAALLAGSAGWHWLWLAPLLMVLVAAVCGMVLLFSACDVYLRDTRYIVESLGLLLMWFTPIFYSHLLIPERFRLLYAFNPLAAVVIGLRAVLLDGAHPPLASLLAGAVSASLLLVAGASVFARLKPRFAEYL